MGAGSSRGVGRDKDCGSIADSRRSAPGLDRPGSGRDADEPEPLDAPGKCPGRGGLKAAAQTGACVPVNAGPRQGFGQGPGKVTPGLRAKSRPVGRAHAGDLFEAPMGNRPEGAASPVLDASVGVSAETGQLQLSASQRRRGPQVPTDPKKNFAAWVGVKRWFFRTRRGSACILAGDEVGPSVDNGCGLPPPAAITPGSIFPVGWHRSWGGAA